MKNLIKRARRAFTIVELVIVIAVIAILAAVLIPTFVSVINSANESSDVQAVKNMNTALIADEAINGKPSTVSEAMEVIEASGLNPNGYQALISGRAIYYSLYREGSSGINRMLYVDLDDNGNITDVIYPSEYKLSDLAGSLYNMYGREIVDSTWMYKTESTIASTSLSNYVKESTGTVTYETGWENALLSKDEDGNLVNTAIYDGNTLVGAAVVDRSGMAAVSEYIESLTDAGKNFTVLVANNIDMNGVEWKPITEFSGSFYGGNKTISNFVISDATADSLSFAAASADANYSFYGFISVFSGTYFGDITLTVDIDEPGNGAYTAEGYNRKNHTSGGAIGAIILTDGEIVVNNVTVTGTVIGSSRAAGVIGFIGGYNATGYRMTGSVTISNCTNKATVSSASNESGTYATAGGIVSIINQWSGSITFKNCTNEGKVKGLWVGGILADAWRSNESTYTKDAAKLTFDSCSNSGELIGYACDANVSSNVNIAVGGILGNHMATTSSSNPMDITITNCSNTGTLTYDISNRTDSAKWTNIFLGQMTSLDLAYYYQNYNGQPSSDNLSGVKNAASSYTGLKYITISGSNTATGTYGTGATEASETTTFSAGTSYVWKCASTSYTPSN